MTFKMPAEAELTAMTLRTSDLPRSVDWYSEHLGFSAAHTENGAALSLPGNRVTIELISEPSAPQRPYPCVGLYHFALLLPDRPSLGAILRKLFDDEVGFEGFADHAVSEAIYLRDPDFNGIELYRDRPQAEWPMGPNGLVMVSDPLDIEGVVSEAEKESGLHADTRFGHVHLHVGDIASTEDFFRNTLGLDLMQRMQHSASFLSAGGYHHHVGINTWAGPRTAPPEATGMLGYRWRVTEKGLEELASHVGADVDDRGELRIPGPAGIDAVIAA